MDAQEQLSFLDNDADFGRADPNAGRDRLYFAIHPDMKATLAVQTLAMEAITRLNLRTRLRANHALHISVLGVGFPDEMSPDELEIAAGAARSVTFRPFEMVFTHIIGWQHGSGGMLVLLCDDDSTARVNALGHRLEEQLRADGLHPAGALDTTAHMTLLYGAAPMSAIALANPIHIDVQGFSLTRNNWGEGTYERKHFALQAAE